MKSRVVGREGPFPPLLIYTLIPATIAIKPTSPALLAGGRVALVAHKGLLLGVKLSVAAALAVAGLHSLFFPSRYGVAKVQRGLLDAPFTKGLLAAKVAATSGVFLRPFRPFVVGQRWSVLTT